MITNKFLTNVAGKALALAAALMMSIAFTACSSGDNDTPATPGIHHQWEYMEPGVSTISNRILDLSEKGKITTLVKYTLEWAKKTGLNASVYYISNTSSCSIDFNEDKVSGTITYRSGNKTKIMSFKNLTDNSMTIVDRGQVFTYKLVKGVKGIPMPTQ